MRPLHVYFILTALWALIYLPGLGDQEIRGEEWRRAIPARTMLQNGDWLVPRSGGKPYVRKPPLINWTTALSFKVTGVQNELTARLPSVLLVWGGVLGIYAFSRRWAGSNAAFVGSVFLLTSVGMIEKGRIAELEVYSIVFTGLAFAAWMAGFIGKISRWTGWLWAGVFLALGMLAKGPAHLLFFYLPVLGACWAMKRWREVWSLPHLAGLAVFFAICLAWAIPFMDAYGQMMGVSGQGVMNAWEDQVTSRMKAGGGMDIGAYLARGPSALVMFLPWILFLPLWWRRSFQEAAFPATDERRLFRGLAVGIVASFAAMILLPSSSARYVAPMLGPVALMTGWVVWNAAAAREWNWSKWWRRALFFFACFLTIVQAVALVEVVGAHSWLQDAHLFPSDLGVLISFVVSFVWLLVLIRLYQKGQGIIRLTWSSGVTIALLLAFGIWGFRDIQRHRQDIRPLALAIREAVQPHDAPLYVFKLGQVPYPFYLPEDTVEVDQLKEMPDEGVRWVLIEERDMRFRQHFEKRHGPARVVAEFASTWGESQKGQKLVLLRFEGLPAKS